MESEYVTRAQGGALLRRLKSVEQGLADMWEELARQKDNKDALIDELDLKVRRLRKEVRTLNEAKVRSSDLGTQSPGNKSDPGTL